MGENHDNTGKTGEIGGKPCISVFQLAKDGEAISYAPERLIILFQLKMAQVQRLYLITSKIEVV